MALVASTVTTVLRKDVAFVLQVQQRPVVVVATQYDTAALAAVAAVRATVRVVLHVLQVHRAFAALAAPAQYLYVVYEI